MNNDKLHLENGSTITLVKSNSSEKWQGVFSNASQLRQCKAAYGLNSQKVADILGAKLKTVNSWLLSPDSPSHRPMPDYRLDHLKLKLRNRKKVNK